MGFINTVWGWITDAFTVGLGAIGAVVGGAFALTMGFVLLAVVGSFLGIAAVDVPYLGAMPLNLNSFFGFFAVVAVLGMFLNFVGTALGLRRAE